MPSREAAQLGVSGLGVTWQREAREGEVRGCFALGVVHVNSRGACVRFLQCGHVCSSAARR